MCEVKIFHNGKKLIEHVSEYEADFQNRTVSAYSFSDNKREVFKNLKKMKWSEFNDSLILEFEN